MLSNSHRPAALRNFEVHIVSQEADGQMEQLCATSSQVITLNRYSGSAVCGTTTMLSLLKLFIPTS